MTLVAHGVTTARLTTGTSAITGVGFQPRAVVFYAALRTATGIGPTSGYCLTMIGWQVRGSGAPAPCCASTWARDNVATSDAGGSSTTNHAIEIIGPASPAVVDCQATISSFDADGFTLDWTDAASQAWRIYWFAIGGSDVTDADAGAFLLSTSTGDQSTTVPGFQPSVIIMSRGSFLYGLGFASGASASNQACMYGCNVSGENPSSTARTFSPGNLGGGYRTTGASHPFTISHDYLFSLKSFDAQGFTVTKSDPPAAQRGLNYLVLEGGSYEVGVETVPTLSGVQTISAAIRPRGVLMFSDLESAASAVADALWAIGAMTFGSAGTVAFAAEDNVSATVVEQYAGDEALAADLDYAGPSVPSLAGPGSLLRGSFGLDWTAVSGDEEQYAYLAVGGSLRRKQLPYLGVGP